jgi:Zn-dependent peptidase ImmA (M78 family)/transcriptional regulator with XRE-family HTH domain
MAEALITGSLLKWARERVGISVEVAAERIKVKAERFEKWETGDARPTIRQAQELARMLHVPLGYLYLDKPPVERVDIPDLRRVGGAPVPALSSDFLAVYRDAQAKQAWYREYALGQGDMPLPFVGRFNLRIRPEAVAGDIAQVLNINEGARREATNWEDFLRQLVAKAENAGILVIRNSVVGNNTHRPLSVEEFRGFALSDDVAPLVFINTADYKAAQIFTLAHELAHIWIAASAVSNIELAEQGGSYDPTEVFCNKVAAEVLVPSPAFETSWDDCQNLRENAPRLASEFRVSELVIARRALDLTKIHRLDYDAFYREQVKLFRHLERLRKLKEDAGKKGRGPSFYRAVRIRNGTLFSRAVVKQALEGRILLRDAGRLLGIKPAKLNALAKELEGV